MKVRELSINNCLSFYNGFNKKNSIILDDFNLFIGSNNAGKSNILKIMEVIKRIMSSIATQGNNKLQDFTISFEGQQEDWIFAQNTNEKFELSFLLEIEKGDMNITQYDHKKKNPVEFMLNLNNQFNKPWPKLFKVDLIIEYKQGTPYLNITKIEIPNEHQAYKGNPTLFDKNTTTLLALRREFDEEVWKVVHFQDENKWNNDFIIVGQAAQNFLRQLYLDVFEKLLINIPAIRKIKTPSDEIVESLSMLRDGSPQNRKIEKSVTNYIKTLIFHDEKKDISFVYPGQSGSHQVRIQLGELQLPLGHYGSAVEQMLIIAAEVARHGSNKIVLIEEPEAHFHPDLQRKFIRFLSENQKLFKHQYLIATHSHIFIDEFIKMQGNVFYVHSIQNKEIEAGFTQVEPFDRNKIKELLKTLGLRPSDIFLANGILIVEGIIDKNIFADWARKIGKSFELASILVIDVEGAGNIHKYLGSEIIQRTCLTNYSMFDYNVKDEVRKKCSGFVPDDNIISLEKGDIEDYYPRNLVLEFASEWGKIKGKKQNEIPTEIKEGETVKSLDILLGSDWWKSKLADKIINEMKPELIDDEIVKKLTNIFDTI